MKETMAASSSRVGPLIMDVMEDVQLLVRKEVELMTSEAKQELKAAVLEGVYAAVGGLILSAGFIFLCIAAVHFLFVAFEGLPLWGGYAIVGLLLSIAGFLLLKVKQFRAK